jgi:hypothetical protein
LRGILGLIAMMMNEQCKKKDKNTFWLITFVTHFSSHFRFAPPTLNEYLKDAVFTPNGNALRFIEQ